MGIKLPELIRDGHGFLIPTTLEDWTWTASSIKLFRRCKRKFYWQYVLRLRQRTQAPPLVIGNWLHDALRLWYRNKRSSMKRIADNAVIAGGKWLEKEVVKGLYSETDIDKLKKGLATLWGMLVGYAGLYANDRKEWKLDRRFVEKRFSHDCGGFLLDGMTDLVCIDIASATSRLVEHKSASQIGEGYMERIQLDTQIRLYVWAMWKVYGIPIDRVIYNVIRKSQLRQKKTEDINTFNERVALDYMSRPGHYFMRETLRFRKGDIAAFVHELQQTDRELENLLTEAGTPVQPFGECHPRSWLPNDAACDDFHRTCEFFNLCTTGLDKGTGKLFRQSQHYHEELEGD